MSALQLRHMALLSFILLRVILTSEFASAHNISLVVMAPFAGPDTSGWDGGPALLPAAIVAAREINRNPDILPGFNLQIIMANGGCSVESTVTVNMVRHFFNNDGNQVVGLIGPACSAAALTVSSLTARHEVSLIHITVGSSPELEDPARETTYSAITSALVYVQLFIELMANNSWDRIATLQDVGRLFFKQVHSKFIETVDSDKVIYTGSILSAEESFIPLDSLRSSLARVVMVFAGGKVAGELLCYAFNKSMVFPNYQWVFHDRPHSAFLKSIPPFRVDGKTISCTEDEMIMAAEGIILNTYNLEQQDKDMHLPVFNRNFVDYQKEYENEFNTSFVDYQEVYKNINKTKSDISTDYSNPYHDAVWAMALALHNASLHGVDLTSYTYNRNNDTKEIARHLKEVNFDGVSGPFAFNNVTRSVRSIIDVQQIMNGNVSRIGTFDSSRKPELEISSGKFIRDTYNEVYIKIHHSVGVLVILVTVIAIVVMFLLQLANIFWHSYHSIKATSPNITHLVFSGCYCFSIALLILSIQETFTFPEGIYSTLYAVLCNLFTWCFVIGYTLIFGTICAKVWRVFRLFRHFRNEKPGHFLSDNALIVFVILLLVIDMAICTTWSLMDPWMTQITRTPSVRGEIVSLSVKSECSCRYLVRWLIGITLYKGVIMILLVVLSILNRRIKKKDFQHTRKINILIYSITMLAGTGIPMFFLLRHVSIYIGYFIFCSLFLTTIFLCCMTLFIMPVLPVLKMKITGVSKADETAKRRRTLAHIVSVGAIGGINRNHSGSSISIATDRKYSVSSISDRKYSISSLSRLQHV